MIIDNKEYRNEPSIKTVWGFFEDYFPLKGKFDIVTGYFTIRALSELYEKVDSSVSFRILSSELVKDEKQEHYVIDLLRGDMGIENTLNLDVYARNAIEFLNRENVKCKAITNAFCHAKAYLYQPGKPKTGFYLTGSPNLTEAGLGLQPSSNLELAIAETADETNSNFKDLKKWFDDNWKIASDTVPVDKNKPRGEKISVKEYFIRQIKDFFKKYTPEEIYYKILFELFKIDIEVDESLEHQKDLSLLQTSIIWKTLFNYQQKGVISLIKMLRKYNGAILADAVGLGKTFSALAVIKYFQNQNYKTMVICPKKLERNWKQYRHGTGSRFDKDDLKYEVRFHTDLQNDRLSLYDNYVPEWLQRQNKVLVVIDESHNLRNEKSLRYRELLNNIIVNKKGHENRDVKILMLSATPINISLGDIKGQFNLIGKGNDFYFNIPDFQVKSLDNLFGNAQKKYNKWCENPSRTIGDLIKVLPQNFFNLTDKLIVARTRKIIEKAFNGKLGFPDKEKPENIYQGVDHFGKFKTPKEINDAFENLFLSAYQPSLFLLPEDENSENERPDGFDNQATRERFLVGMMKTLFFKRLESSWYSLLITIEKVLDIHQKTLDLVEKFINQGENALIYNIPEDDDNENGGVDVDDIFSIRDGAIKLSELQNIEGFRKQLQTDVNDLKQIRDSILHFKDAYEKGIEKDLKFEELKKIIIRKSEEENKKVIIFTAYADTAKHLFEELRGKGFNKIGMASGSECLSTENCGKIGDFNTILQRFAPYSKLYKELDWTYLYENKPEVSQYYDTSGDQWNVPYEEWKKLIKKHEPQYYEILKNPIDILIATDCLSEGQNLQDADMQINYDIHWNPVRLIQRFGRIDRLGSPNKVIKAVNFWPTKDINAYLNLEKRIHNRMAIVNLGGGETIDLTKDYEKIVKDNPLVQKNENRLLIDLQNSSISDIEDSQTLSLSDLSEEVYRQDLVEFFENNKVGLEKIPNGVFSGFEYKPEDQNYGDALVALLAYPHREEGKKTPYTQTFLLLQPLDPFKESEFREVNHFEILQFLKNNKNKERSVPEWIDKGDTNKITMLSEIFKIWISNRVVVENQKSAKNILMGLLNKNNEKGNLLEERLKLENFDLIAWEYVEFLD